MGQFLNPADHAELDALLASCAEEPWNIDLRLILSDWLEEHGDPRAELYRLVADGGSLDSWFDRWETQWPGKELGRSIYLFNNRLVLNASFTPRGNWVDIVREGWINTLVAAYPLPEASLRGLPRLSEVVFTHYGDHPMRLIANFPTHKPMRSLSIIRGTVTRNVMRPISKIAGLVELDLTGSHPVPDFTIEYLRELPNLRRLTLADTLRTTSKCMNAICKLKQLTHLSLASLPWVLTEHVEQLVDRLGELEHLDLSCCWRLTNNALTPLKRLKKLTSLGLNGATGLTDMGEFRRGELLNEYADAEVIRRPLRVCGTMSFPETISDDIARGARGITREGLASISSLETLERLSIAACQQVDASVLLGLASLPRLRELDVSLCETVGLDWFSALRRMPMLEKLHMGAFQTKLEPQWFVPLAEHPQLRRIYIKEGHAFVAAVGRILPKCRIIAS